MNKFDTTNEKFCPVCHADLPEEHPINKGDPYKIALLQIVKNEIEELELIGKKYGFDKHKFNEVLKNLYKNIKFSLN